MACLPLDSNPWTPDLDATWQVRTEHQLQLAALSEEHEAATRRTWRRAQRAQGAALSLIPRLHERRLLGVIWLALRQATNFSRAARLARAEHIDQMGDAQRERIDLEDRLAAAEATAAAAVAAAAAGQSAARATADAAAAERAKLSLHVESATSAADTEKARARFASEAARMELSSDLDRVRAESEARAGEARLLQSTCDAYRAQIEGLSEQIVQMRSMAITSQAEATEAVAQRAAAMAVAVTMGDRVSAAHVAPSPAGPYPYDPSTPIATLATPSVTAAPAAPAATADGRSHLADGRVLLHEGRSALATAEDTLARSDQALGDLQAQLGRSDEANVRLQTTSVELANELENAESRHLKAEAALAEAAERDARQSAEARVLRGELRTTDAALLRADLNQVCHLPASPILPWLPWPSMAFHDLISHGPFPVRISTGSHPVRGRGGDAVTCRCAA